MMVFRGMTVALAALLAFGVSSAEAAGSRETRGKPGRAASAASAPARATGPAVRSASERSASAGRRGEARAEPRGRGAAEARGRVLAEPRGRAGARTESRGRVIARVDDRRGARATARDRRQVDAPIETHRGASYRTVGLFSRTAAASTLRDDEGEERRGGGKMGRRGGAWHAGLPEADGEQTACPAGTMSVLARGHSDTFRCMPI